MKIQIRIPEKTSCLAGAVGILFAFAAVVSAQADPITNCWFTTDSGQYARIYTNAAMQTAGTPLTTWSNGSQTQSLPVYCGVQDVYSSTNWVYVRSTGLASYNMGPWFLNAAHTNEFPNLPVNQKNLYRIPRTNNVPTTKTENGGGQVGIFVDGVAMFNSWDAYYWNGSADVNGGGTGCWNRDAYVNEGPTFDAGNAHQQNTGTYHYHADPIGLRYQLGDHVDYDAITKTYYEDTDPPTQHSPILGWVADGFPIYGPYGYSNPTNPASGIRRMVSGYVPRNGLNGTDNLSTNGAARSTIPAWAQRLYRVSANQFGPVVSNTPAGYEFGRYMEDNAYLGDLTNAATGSNYVQGVDFDLNENNCRWCVTPDFPNGTYAYFVAIDSTGTPVFPYDIGRGYYGSPIGGMVGSITEPVVTNFLGGPDLTPSLNAPSVNNGTVTLTWSATEGGTYLVESTTNFSTWATNSTTVAAVLNNASYTNNPTGQCRFYRVARTALAAYDPVSVTTGATFPVPGGSVSLGNGTNITLSISLPSTPPSPPANAPITSVALGSLTATSVSYQTQGTVLANFTIPANAETGAQNVVVTFTSGPPPYTFTGGLTIDP